MIYPIPRSLLFEHDNLEVFFAKPKTPKSNKTAVFKALSNEFTVTLLTLQNGLILLWLWIDSMSISGRTVQKCKVY